VSPLNLAGAFRSAPAGWLRRDPERTCSTSAPTSRFRRATPASGFACCPSRSAGLEQRCDEVNAELEPLRSFVLSGGTPRGRLAARLPHGLPARGAPRRRASAPTRVPRRCAYLNRLSDLLFILAREGQRRR